MPAFRIVAIGTGGLLTEKLSVRPTIIANTPHGQLECSRDPILRVHRGLFGG